MLEVSSSFQDENQEEMESFSMGNAGKFGDLSDSNLLENINFDDYFDGVDVDGDILPDLEMFASEFSVSYGEESKMNSNREIVGDDKNCSKEIVSKRDESVIVDGGGKGRKSSKKKAKGKRKVKVNWTPELHRRFVQAVEELGIDKAVPSRILEIMGIHSLTRHNIASHLQKYRSHRKHLEARAAEAARWNQRRSPTTIGFPLLIHHFRPLHVWGHPSTQHPLSCPNSFCHSQHNLRSFVGSCPLLPHVIYRADHAIGAPSPASFFGLHPSKENIDEAIEEVLSKPWLPLPLGLKAPALDSVMGELHRHGISNIPPFNPNN